jgi:hypothetical protein
LILVVGGVLLSWGNGIVKLNEPTLRFMALSPYGIEKLLENG